MGAVPAFFLVIDTAHKTTSQKERDDRAVVLKDVWVHPDRPREDVLLRKILEGATADQKENFLTVIHAGDVAIQANGEGKLRPDHTGDLIRRGHAFVLQDYFSLNFHALTGAPISVSTSRSHGHRLPLNKDQKPAPPKLVFNDRQHYRIVFRECGTSIDGLGTFHKIFTALRGGIKGTYVVHITHTVASCSSSTALKRVHDKGYVHRDISTGNILLVERGQGSRKREVGVLIDFEYCKEPGEEFIKPAEFRTVSDQARG